MKADNSTKCLSKICMPLGTIDSDLADEVDGASKKTENLFLVFSDLRKIITFSDRFALLQVKIFPPS